MNPRKLAAIDIVVLGCAFIIVEFAGGVLLCIALGAFVVLRASSSWQTILGLYLTSLGINYVPMLAYAIALTRRHSARAELGDELANQRVAMRKYRRQSLFLLVPLLVPILSLRQRCHSERTGA